MEPNEVKVAADVSVEASEVEANTETGEVKGEMKRVLGTGGMVVQGLAWLCPACILMYYGFVNQMSGGAFPLCVLIAGCVMFVAALAYANMGKKYIEGGSVYTYVSGSFGPRIGYMSGWLILLDYILMPMICYLSSGLYLNILFPSISANVFIVLTVVFVFICNFLGIKFATLVNLINVVVPILLIILTVIYIIRIVSIGGPDTAGSFLSMKAFAPDTLNWPGVLQCSAVLCVTFIGFDVATTMAGEAKNPTKTVPRAVVIIVSYTVVSFFIMAYMLNCGWLYVEGMLSDPNTAITEYFVYLGAGWLNMVFVPINTLACIGCCIAGNISSTRVMYNMAMNGFLPKKIFAYIHPRFKTPSFSILIVALCGLVALAFQGQLADAANICSFGGLLGMVLVNACVIKAFYITDKSRGFGGFIKYILIPVIGGGATLFLWFQLEGIAKIVGFSWLLLGFILLLIKTKGFKEKVTPISFEE